MTRLVAHPAESGPEEAPDAESCCGHHAAHLYTDPASLFGEVGQYSIDALDRGEAVVIIATPRHIAGILGVIRQAGHDVVAQRRTGQITCVDAEPCLAAIMKGRDPQEHVFLSIVRELIEQALIRFAGLAAYGELVNLLWQQGNHLAAHQLEDWWIRLIQRYGFRLLCGYRVSVFDERAQSGLRSICQTHSRVLPALNESRFDQAVTWAMRRTFPDADVAALRQTLLERSPWPERMPAAQATLMALHEILPAVAQDVRMLARDFYHDRPAAGTK